MRFLPVGLEGACLVEVDPFEDERGLFARTFCEREFRDRGLVDGFVQCNTSWNARKGTLRGMHYQREPSREAKLVRCTRGALWDVIVDLRTDSDTYLKWFGVELTADNRTSLYIPPMFAHGFITLEDGTEAFYQMSDYYEPSLSEGIRHDDPKIGIEWPEQVSVISEKDRQWESL